MTSKIKAVIFDYDGVLNDSLDVIRRLYNEFYELGITNKYFETNEEVANFFVGDPHKNLENAGAKLTPELIKYCDGIVSNFIPREDKKVDFYEGIDKMLLSLADDGYRLAVVSNGNKTAIINKLRKYGVESVVELVYGYEDVPKPKPHPIGIQKCLKELNLKPEEALYVGDLEDDIGAAKAAGVKMIATNYGYLSYADNADERLKDADILVDTVDELYESIKNA
ncbi:MAG: HAD family hydrolase [Nanoarchaeota archaeon]|nr:HAD family hydrolase [Nanoarchaeota archaeon]MCG2717742.1 HAD family hydrolase [Nanoarchaeota archaeon]